MFDLSDLLLYEEERIRRWEEKRRRKKARPGADATPAVTPEVIDHYRGIAHGLRKAWIRQALDAAARMFHRILRNS